MASSPSARGGTLAVLAWGLLVGCAREAATSFDWAQVGYSRRVPTRVPAPFEPTQHAVRSLTPSRWVPPWAGDPARPFAELVWRAAWTYQIPSELLWAMMKAESGFRSNAISRVGASGLMQLMPRTAEALGVEDIFDPEQNVFAAAMYLRRLANRFQGRLDLMIAGYNAGPGAVSKHGGVPPYRETRRYVRRVLELYYSSAAPASTEVKSASAR